MKETLGEDLKLSQCSKSFQISWAGGGELCIVDAMLVLGVYTPFGMSLSLSLFLNIVYIWTYIYVHTAEHHQKCTANFRLRQYSDYEVYFQRIRQGHRNVLNPGAMPRLAMTSATQGEPKFLPDVTDLGKTFYRRPGRLREYGM